MALFSPPLVSLRCCPYLRNPNPNSFNSMLLPSIVKRQGQFRSGVVAASNLCEEETLTLDARSLTVKEYFTEAELLAAVRLRIRTFYEFNQASYNIEDHRRHLMEREYAALKERVAGMRIGFKRVTCINATLPMSHSLLSAQELCASCKFAEDGVNQVVVGTLDLNQCLSLADELTGKRPQGSGSDLTRAYLSNVCVAKELQRNGLGYALVAKSKEVAREWGITDLYVHVAVDNKAAKKLYEKSGFVYENEEPAWQSRFLGRPRRFLLWANLAHTSLINDQFTGFSM